MRKFKIGDPVRYMGTQDTDLTQLVVTDKTLSYLGRVVNVNGQRVTVKLGDNPERIYPEADLVVGLSNHTYRDPIDFSAARKRKARPWETSIITPSLRAD